MFTLETRKVSSPLKNIHAFHVVAISKVGLCQSETWAPFPAPLLSLFMQWAITSGRFHLWSTFQSCTSILILNPESPSSILCLYGHQENFLKHEPYPTRFAQLSE